MNDLIERLRAVSSTEIQTMYDLTREAAKEIERITDERETYRRAWNRSDDELARSRSPPTSEEFTQEMHDRLRQFLDACEHGGIDSIKWRSIRALLAAYESLARSEAAHKADAERSQQELDKLRPGGSGGTGAVWYIESWAGDGVGGPRSGRSVRCSLHGEFSDIDYCPTCRAIMAARGK